MILPIIVHKLLNKIIGVSSNNPKPIICSFLPADDYDAGVNRLEWMYDNEPEMVHGCLPTHGIERNDFPRMGLYNYYGQYGCVYFKKILRYSE